MLIGVLALQGAFIEHEKMLRSLGVDTVQVRLPGQLDKLDGLVIPGGESTTMGKLMNDFGLFEPIREKAENGLPVLGTCAGMIMMAREIAGSSQPRLGLMDISVERNAFGRQVDSFEADINIEAIGEEPFRAVFIRAPYILGVDGNVQILARHGDKIVAARQGRFMVLAFHPELTRDNRLHKYFLENMNI
ncbi:pyridoxine biosynthesis glutamine amidotransferase glutaminase subunit [Desulfocucumis palustris]|uniref:Pyridoxal 5'-phosphate synthase subunit PdxT n=1 Tax=Desulfocucumis palustris TaxID=1898651 RepID=A0A2L2XDK1_9FIRM|nr:pyridoxal 5'-phosphate synthase glutaminase subunit PdxT [Desulfocucumis palustris]GBF34427.1 pyridoxine biosynthesis glutamine amidotransferase glutaminase subunit [Desulfocucumis palustris]